MAVFWDVAPRSLVITDVSEELTASIFRFISKARAYGDYTVNQPRIRFNIRHYENLKSRR